MEHLPESIAFELSNRCNYSAQHPKCPTDCKADPIFLKTSIIQDVVDYMGSLGWKGNFFLNIYNEPMIDPRFHWICEYIINHSRACIQIFTNGWNLNDWYYKELHQLCLGRIGFTVSVYSDSEEERLRKIEGLNVQRIELDNRMDIYKYPDTARGPCKAPSVYVMINHRGELVLCCRDYTYTQVLSDLNVTRFDYALTNSYRKAVCADLRNGIRYFNVCQRCHEVGWGVSQTEWLGWHERNKQ